jgi:hypothetical protein
MFSGTLTMEFDGKIIKFDIYDDMRFPVDDNSIYYIDVIDFFLQKVFELDGLEVAISEHLERKHKELALSIDLHEIVVVLNGFPKLQR